MAIRPRSVAALVLFVFVTAKGGTARALDKQGSAHGGAAAGVEESGVGVSGALMLGVSLKNDSYAARPDNTGLALMRYAAHADVDVIGRKLSFPLDVNMAGVVTSSATAPEASFRTSDSPSASILKSRWFAPRSG